MRNQEKRYLVVALLPLILCLSASPARSQVDVQTTLAPVSTLSINDVDFINSTSPHWLFTIMMTPTGQVPIQVRLRIKVGVVFSADGSFNQAALYESPAFELTAPRTITNLDLRQPGLSAPVRIDPEARRRFEETGLPSGTIPAGAYRFIVEVTSADLSTVLGSDEDELVVTNPGTVELLMPSDDETVTTPFPLFQWRGDAASWHIAVFHRLPGQTGLEETASGVPHLTADATGQSFQYPAAGTRALEQGETYVWYVEGMQPATGGSPQTFRSPLRSFTVATGSAALMPSLLDELESTLGPRYHDLIQQIRSEGLSPTGAIRLNGSPISTTELMTILGMLRSNPDAVTSVVIE